MNEEFNLNNNYVFNILFIRNNIFIKKIKKIKIKTIILIYKIKQMILMNLYI